MRKFNLRLIICTLVIIGYVAVFGQGLSAWTGFPKGADAYARITRIVYNLDFFPHVFWQYHWANGMPNYKTEAPLFYFIGTLLAKFLSLGPNKPLIVIGFLTFVMIGIGVFGFVVTKTKKWTAGLVASILALSSFSVWFWMVAGGIYPRIMAVGLMMITLWRMAVFLEEVKLSLVFPKKAFIAAVIPFALTMMAHVLMSFFLWISLLFLFLAEELSFKKKLKYGFWIYFTSFCLAGFFFLPVVFGFAGGGSGRFIGVISPVIPALKYYLYDFAGMGPFLIPLLAVLSVLVIVSSRKLAEIKPSLLRISWPLLIMFILFSTYAFIGYTGLSGRYYYINGFIPLSATLFISLYGAMLVGLWFGRLEQLSQRLWSVVGIVIIVIIAVTTVIFGTPRIRGDDRIINVVDTAEKSEKNPVYKLQQILKFSEEDLNHRFAPFDAAEAVWFNAVYKIPQVRDYYGQGILYPDWRYWFEQAVWDPEKFTIDEARAALDWFSVRWFSAYESNVGIAVLEEQGLTEQSLREGAISVEDVIAKSKSRYFREPGFKMISFGRIQYDGIQEEFEVENPSPILSAVNTPTVLFIGKDANYNLLFSNLTFGNYSSAKIIPVRGGKYLDDYNLETLKEYDFLLLYGYEYRDFKKADKLLSDYLNQGGNVIWETWDSPEVLSKNKKAVIPQALPFGSLKTGEVKGGDWNFSQTADPLIGEIDFGLFSPPLYNGTPWKITTGDSGSLKPWAKILLSSGSDPLLAMGTYGKGKVIWSGFNFLYHINAYKNMEEAKLLYQWLDKLGTGQIPTIPIYKANFVHPEKREIVINSKASGVLFKESYYPNWGAYLQEAGGKKTKLEIKLAGPGMSYLSLGEKITFPATVVLEYHFSLVEEIGVLLSLLTFIILTVYSVNGQILERFAAYLRRKQGKNLGKTFNWWNDEEV